jgi:hypothetical protein
MKLWEVMKLLEENPTDVYEAKMNESWRVRMTVKDGFGGYYYFEVFNSKRLIDQSRGGGAFNGNVALSLDWQLVRQPVTWQEAIQAWADGKVVYVENKAGGRVYRCGGEGEKMYLLQSEVKNGTWYVEDVE